MKSNRINFEIPASTLKEVNDAIELAKAKLEPYLLSDITSDELNGHARMGDVKLSFVSNILESVQFNESMVPRYHNLEEAKADKRYFESLSEVCGKLEQLTSRVVMNQQLAGVELLDFSNDVYATIKRLYQSGDPNAKAIFPSLRPHYAKPKRRGKEEV
jgi:hypothetical protein